VRRFLARIGAAVVKSARPMLRPPIVRAAIAVAFAFLLVHALRSGCDHDEIEHLHDAWLVSQGQVPFVDFVEVHHPTVFYLLAPLARALAPSPRALVFAARALYLAVLALALFAFRGIAARMTQDRSAAWAPLVLLGCFFFARNSMEVRSDPWMSAFVIAAFWCWTRYLADGGARWAALAGFAIGSAIVFSQKAVPFAGLIGIGTLVALARDRSRWVHTARGAGLVAAGAAVPISVFAAAIWRAGYWNEFAFWNYTFNRYLNLQDSRHVGPAFLATVGASAGEAPLLWAAGLAGVVLAIRRPRIDTSIAAVVAVGGLFALFLSKLPWSHDLLVTQVFLGILAVLVIDLLLQSARWRTAAATLVLLMVAKTAAVSTFYTEVPDGPRVQRAALAATNPADRVAMPPPYHPIFRKDSFYFWVAAGLLVPGYLELCAQGPCPAGHAAADARVWAESPPRLVFAPPDEPLWSPPYWDEHRTEYTETSTPGLWMRRGTPAEASAR
jgi:4-amino-4-deoxy-L-arabinose transferase-like glycosyltransferase